MTARRMGFVALVLSAWAMPARATQKLLAVLPLDVSNTGGRMKTADRISLEETLRDVASNSLPGWTILSGDNTIQLLEDNGIDPTKCTQASCHLNMARQIEANKFFSGAVQWVDGTYTASIRLMDTKTGRILASARVLGRSTIALENAFAKEAPKFFQRAGLVGDTASEASAEATEPQDQSPAVPTPKAELPPVPDVPGSLQSSGDDLNASTAALVARDQALQADKNGAQAPDVAAQAWEALAAVTDRNPYQHDASVRAAQWEKYAEKKRAQHAERDREERRLSQILPLTSIPMSTKETLVESFEAKYGAAAAKPLLAMLPTFSGRWDIQADTVRDSKTGLTWQRQVPTNEYRWQAAHDYCAQLSLAGGGWRLPTQKELMTLLDMSAGKPTIDHKAFPNTPADWFWTSSVSQHDTSDDWAVFFDSATTDDERRWKSGYVRCVR